LLIIILILIKFSELQSNSNKYGRYGHNGRNMYNMYSGNDRMNRMLQGMENMGNVSNVSNVSNYSGIEGFTDQGYAGLSANSDAPWTIDKPTKLIITDILRKIINKINKQTGMSYYFTAYDQLSQEVVSTSETRFTADLFVHEMRNLATRRFIIIFVVNFAKKSVDVEYINLSNAFKLPPKDFMGSSINDTPPELILQDDNLLNNSYHIMGLNTSKIDFSILKDDEGKPKQVPTPTEFQKWILPMGIAASFQNPQALFPSRRQSRCWDTSGANYIQQQTPMKMGVNNSPMLKIPYPYFNPTVNLQKEWNTEYKGMFDLVDSAGNGGGRGVAGSP